MQLISTNLTRKLYFFLFIIILVSLPYKHTNVINSTSIILCGLVWILEWSWIEKWLKIKTSPLILIFIPLFLLYVLGLFYSANVKNGLVIIERLLPLMVFPLIIGSSTNPLSKKQIEIIIWAFVGSIFIATLICLIHTLFYYFYKSSSEFLFHDAFCRVFLDITAIYLSVHVGFCMLWITDYILRNNLKKIKKSLLLTLIFYFLIILFFLNIRTALSTLLLIYLSGILIYFQYKKQLLKGLLLAGACLVLFFIVILIIPTTREKFFETINLEESIKLNANEDHSLGKVWGGRAIRVAIWQSAFDLAKDNLLFGVGTGDVQDQLQITYRKNGFLFASEYNRYNAHNQYIETLLAVGLLGLSILLASFIYPITISLKRKDFLYLAFIIYVAANCLTETLLGRQKGAVFFGLINALLFFQYYNSKNNENHTTPTN